MTMNKHLKNLVRLAVILPVLFLWSCNDGDDSSVLRFSEGGSVPYNSTGQFLEIYTDKAWSISSVSYDGSPEADWCTYTPASGSGSDWKQQVSVTYTVNQGATRKALFTVDFEGSKKSILLTQLSENDTDTGIPLDIYMELPDFTEEGSLRFATHYVPGMGGMRNYSVLYDSDTHLPVWVAYPMHTVYNVPSGTRTNAWQWDPIILEADQTDMSRSSLGNDTDGNRFERGHMLPSASRFYTVRGNEVANAQTFYYTNMTPQNSGNNGGIWANLESRVRGWQGGQTDATKHDTLYVVTGTVLRRADNPTEIIRYTTNNVDGKRIAVPNYYYKALLKRSIVSGQASYKSVAFWIEHKNYGRNVAWSEAISVRELEKRTGINFFPELEQEVQDVVELQTNASDWGFR